LRIFNPDGSEAEVSGNGAREALLYLHRHGWTGEWTFTIKTTAGELRAMVLDERTCSVEMGRATLQSSDFPSGGPDGRGTLIAAGRRFAFQHVNVGNPQCVIDAGEDVEQLDLGAIGPAIERNELFPNRTNVAFISSSVDGVRARIYERGVGETLSSGTGACGSAVAAVLAGARSPVKVRLDGGDLEVGVGKELELTLTGPAVPVFSGHFSDDFTAELKGAE
jgi:diaminopimelate epimerase